jgi:flagellar biosynthesis GTPase FlhF
LVDGAHTPKADNLPDSIKPLVRRNAVEVRNTYFGRDAEALVDKIYEALKSPRERLRFLASAAALLRALGRWHVAAGSAAGLLLVGWIGLYLMDLPPWVAWAQSAHAQAEQQRLAAIKEEEQRRAKAADIEAKLKAAEAEQQRLAAIKEEEQRRAEAADVEAKLKAAEAEQQRLKEEVQRQTKATADAEEKRKAAEVEQQRLKEEVQRQAEARIPVQPELHNGDYDRGHPRHRFRRHRRG